MRERKRAFKTPLWIKVALPLIFGTAAILWLFSREYVPGTWSAIRFTPHAIVGILLAWMCMAGRDFGLMWRFRALSDGDLSWIQSLRVTMLCEFTSAVTPSTVGGSALAMVFMHREGLQLGRATTLMLVTLFLDELFFVITCPLAVLMVPYHDLFSVAGNSFVMGLRAVFWSVYVLITLWTIILFLGIFIRPQSIRKILMTIFRLPLLKRWRQQVTELGDSMVTAGHALKKKTSRWWTQAFAATAFSWFSRYLIVNALFFGFVPAVNQLMVLARQMVVWLVLIVSPTPGGSGVSEWLFTDYYGDLISRSMPDATSVTIGATVIILALSWRIVSYYVYLFIGLFLMPSFFKKKRNDSYK